MNIIQNNDLWQREVEILPYIQAFPQMLETQQFDEKKVVISEDHDLLFGIHSSKSFLIRHTEALEIVNDAIVKMFNAEPRIEVTSVKQGSKIRAKIALDSFPEIDLGGGDVNQPFLFLNNSYARAGDFKLDLGVFRQICSNGAVVGHSVAGFNSKQLIDEGFNATSIQGKIARIIDDAKFLTDLWMSWKDTKLGYEESYAIFEKKFSKATLESILNPELFPMNMWDCYNAFTAHSTHVSKTASAQIATDNIITSLFYGRNSPLRDLDNKAFETLKLAKEVQEAELMED